MAKKIDFSAINGAALASFRSLLSEWLPGGEFSGTEYRVLNPTRADNKKGSFSISTSKGVWMDFASGDAGSDPISLFAYLFHNNDQGAAAKDLAGLLGIEGKANTRGPAVQAKQQAQKAGVDPTSAKPANDSPWQSILPPANAPERHQAHPVRGLPEAVWTYRGIDGAVLGYVFRFKTSDGGKEVLPLTWCKHSVSGREEWRWMQWVLPRPLYGLHQLPDSDDKTILIVEGEKCADAAMLHLPDFAVLTWSGGSKAVDKADWSVLRNRRVIIWPDCDAQRDKHTDELLTEDKQPGMMAAVKVADILRGLGCEVAVMQIPAPGEKPGGWDVADAIAEGLTQDLADYINQHTSFIAPAAELPSTPSAACAGGGGSGDVSEREPGQPEVGTDSAWYFALERKPGRGIVACRANIGRILMQHPQWRGAIGFNEFSGQVVKLKPTPWGNTLGPWENADDAALDEWLTFDLKIIIKGLGTIAEAVAHAANSNKFHPVRDYLNRLPPWDNIPRLNSYLCDLTGNEQSDYLRLAGRFFLIAMVSRIFKPGCKFDYMLVLEGNQGLGKSTFFRMLADEWFSETPFEIGTNEGNMSIQGVWLQEMAEMGMFNRAEDNAFKTFLAIVKDKFRRPYDRRPIEMPRVCLFGGTTNQRQYLKDHTGNRRIWPVYCHYIDTDALQQCREQLLAEALQAFKAGERFHPDRDEEAAYFEPEQRLRLIAEGWEDLIKIYLADPKADVRLTNFFTTNDLLTKAIGLERSKIDERATARVGRIMSKIGWERMREPTKLRRWGYVRPEAERETQSIFNDIAGSYDD